METGRKGVCQAVGTAWHRPGSRREPGVWEPHRVQCVLLVECRPGLAEVRSAEAALGGTCGPRTESHFLVSTLRGVQKPDWRCQERQ